MASVKLDQSKLLGFKIVAKDDSGVAVATSIKLGTKKGDKGQPPADR